MTRITKTTLKSVTPKDRPFYVRDDSVQGFGIKVSTAGRISFIVDARDASGQARRITLGQHPIMSLEEAREAATEALRQIRFGTTKEKARTTVGEVFDNYTSARDLRKKTKDDYINTFKAVFSDWRERPIASISRKDVEDRFILVRDTRGLPTAVKAFRILGAVFTFAQADELVESNPVEVIKQKRFKRTIKPRERYLSDDEIEALMGLYRTRSVDGINYIVLLLATGLRRSEGLSLRWEDVDLENAVMVVRGTKNGTDHYVPISPIVREVLDRQGNETEYVFPGRNGHLTEPSKLVDRVVRRVGFKFTLHDMRRTFATHAEANGIPYQLIQRALNHSSSSVTDRYIIKRIDSLRVVFDRISEKLLSA